MKSWIVMKGSRPDSAFTGEGARERASIRARQLVDSGADSDQEFARANSAWITEVDIDPA